MGGLFFVPMVGLLGILIAWYRRDRSGSWTDRPKTRRCG